MSNFLLSVEMQNSSLYMVKSVIVKSVKIANTKKSIRKAPKESPAF